MFNVVLILVIVYLVYTIIPTFYYKVKMYLKRKKRGKKIYLTFDDGPSIYTPILLDLLKKYNVKATFFTVAKFSKNNKDIVKRIIDEGHLIGMHSYKHTSAHLEGIISTYKDFKNSLKVMNDFTNPIYYRPPWGAVNLSSMYLIKKYKLKLVLWNVMVGDWKKNSTNDKIKEKLLNRITGNDIICLHDGRGKDNAPLRTIKALEEVIPILLKEKYIFETVDKYEK